MNNTQNTNEINFPTSGHCKKVKDIINNIDYGSVTEAAFRNNVKPSTMSVAIERGYRCNGSFFMFEKDLHKNPDKLCAETAREKVRADRAEAKLKALDEEMAEYRKWKAEKEAEERRLEAEHKAKEEHKKAIAKAKEKVAKYEAMRERKAEQLKSIDDKLMAAEIELEALLDGKEVA